MNLTVHTKPGSSKGPLVELDDDTKTGSGSTVTVYLRERAVDGKANTALIEVLAKHFGVARSRVQIVRGHSSRLKFVRIDGNLTKPTQESAAHHTKRGRV